MKEILITIVSMACLYVPALLFFCTNIDRIVCAIASVGVVVADILFWKWLDRGE